MSVRRRSLAPALALSTLAGALQLNGYRVLHEWFAVAPGDAGFQLANAALQFAEFGVAVALPAAVGYLVGIRSDLRENHLALAGVVALAALVGYAVSVGVTLAVTNPGRFRLPAPTGVSFLVTNTLEFAVAVLAGAGVGYVRAVRDGSHAEVARPE